MMKRFMPLLMLPPLMAGCSLIPAPEVPPTAIGSPYMEGGISPTVPVEAVPRDWWALYGSGALNALVEEALSGNTDMAAAIERVAQARAQLRIAGASLVPNADASVAASDDLSDGDGDLGASVRGGLAYELDLFGGNRAARQAAAESLRGSEYAAEAVRLATTATVVTSAFTLATLEERLRLAEEGLERARETLELTNQRFEAGVASGLEQAQQQTQVAQTEASIASLRQQRQAAVHALAVLVGQTPAQFVPPMLGLADLSLPVVAPETPASLLFQRPDVQQAEATLRAANANIGAARAALFPSLNVGLDTVLQIDPGGSAVTLSGSLLQPIFQGGRLAAGVDLSEARMRELAQSYRATVLTAVQEVEDAVSSLRTTRLRLASLEIAQRSAAKTYNLSRQRFDVGAIDMLTLLDAQRTLISANDSLAQAKADYANATVLLIRALGGGWRNAS